VLTYRGLSCGCGHRWTEVVTVPPWKTSRVAVRFDTYTDTYIFHCHVLKHEDHGMMATFEVVP